MKSGRPLKTSKPDERFICPVACHGEPLERVPRGSRPLGRRSGFHAPPEKGRQGSRVFPALVGRGLPLQIDLAVAGPDETLDTFYRGRILVLQKKKGYRFAVDAPLLADFIRTRPTDEVLELGTGNGIIPLLLSLKPFRHITAVEIQETLADLARRNARLNKLEDKISVIRGDFREYRPRKKFDIIFSNPPYIKKKTGFLSASAEKSVAKHEIKCDILDVMRKTGELLEAEGRAYFIYPAKRQEDLVQAAEKFGLSLRALRFVRARSGDPANVFLAECGFGAGSPRTLRPLILYDDRGAYTPEVRKIFEGRRRGPAA